MEDEAKFDTENNKNNNEKAKKVEGYEGYEGYEYADDNKESNVNNNNNNNTVNKEINSNSGYENDTQNEENSRSKNVDNKFQQNKPAFFSGFTFYSFDFSNIQPISLLGEGNYGSVWKSSYKNTIYAVKYLRLRRKTERIISLFRSMFHEISCALPNRNVVRHFGCFTGDFSEFGIVMEYMEKGSLESALKTDQNLISSLPLRMQIAVDIARGMNSLHSSSPSIIHLDLRSSNVLLDHNYCAKIGDFGVSISKSKGMDEEGEYEVKGFIQCMAPEVFAGLIGNKGKNIINNRNDKKNARYSCKADVYSFGLLLIELLTCKSAFYNWQKHLIKFALFKGFLVVNPIPFSSYFPSQFPGLKELGERCLDGVAENRPSFAEIILTLENILSIKPSVVILSQYSPLLSILSHYKNNVKEENNELINELNNENEEIINEKINKISEKEWANTTDEEGRTMLHYAAMRGDVEIVKYLLNHSAKSILVDKIELKTPLHYACLYGKNILVVSLLINHMKNEFLTLSTEEKNYFNLKTIKGVVDVAEGKNGMTSLHLSALAGNFDVLSHLVKNESANLSSLDYSNANLLHHCARNSSVECLKIVFLFIFKEDFLRSIRFDPLDLNFNNNNDNNNNNNNNNDNNYINDNNYEICHFNSNNNIINQLNDNNIKNNNDNNINNNDDIDNNGGGEEERREMIGIESKDSLGRTPLHYATFSGNSDLVSLLLQYGADPNSEDKFGMTAMAGVCFYNHVDCLKVLLSFNASPLVVDRHGVSPLQCAVYLGNEEIVNLLLTYPTIDIHQVNGDGNATIHLAAINGHENLCKILLHKGADVNMIGCSLMTPLMQAVIGGHIECVKLLIANFADINLRDERGMTSMMWGCYLGHFDIVKEIISQPEIELNAITINKQNALHFAIAFGSKNKNLLSFLLSFPEIKKDQKDEEGVTPLLQACAQNEPDLVRLLINAKCDLNERSNSGGTPLHLAVTRKSIEIAKILLSSPFLIVSPPDNFGFTPIAYAMMSKDVEMITLLARSHPVYPGGVKKPHR